jgi:Interferon-induced transmembrane protein
MTSPPPPPPGYPPQPPGYGAQPPAGSPPNNYLVWSILVTLFCCLPFGIVAIIKSTQVSGLWAQGQYAEAQASAAAAKKWITWSVIVGLIGAVIGVIVNVASMSDSSGAAALMLSSF